MTNKGYNLHNLTQKLKRIQKEVDDLVAFTEKLSKYEKTNKNIVRKPTRSYRTIKKFVYKGREYSPGEKIRLTPGEVAKKGLFPHFVEVDTTGEKEVK